MLSVRPSRLTSSETFASRRSTARHSLWWVVRPSTSQKDHKQTGRAGCFIAPSKTRDSAGRTRESVPRVGPKMLPESSVPKGQEMRPAGTQVVDEVDNRSRLVPLRDSGKPLKAARHSAWRVLACAGEPIPGHGENCSSEEAGSFDDSPLAPLTEDAAQVENRARSCHHHRLQRMAYTAGSPETVRR